MFPGRILLLEPSHQAFLTRRLPLHFPLFWQGLSLGGPRPQAPSLGVRTPYLLGCLCLMGAPGKVSLHLVSVCESSPLHPREGAAPPVCALQPLGREWTCDRSQPSRLPPKCPFLPESLGREEGFAGRAGPGHKGLKDRVMMGAEPSGLSFFRGRICRW